MKFNKTSHLIEFELRSLGVFKQIDGTYAFSERSVDQYNMDDLSLSKYDSLLDGVKFLKNNLDDDIMEYCGIWRKLEDLIGNVSEDVGEKNIPRKMTQAVILNLLRLSGRYKDLDEVRELLLILRDSISIIGDTEASMLSYFSTIIYMVDDEISTSYERILDIEDLIEGNKTTLSSDEHSKQVTSGSSSMFGMDDGMGGRGRNNMWSTPYGGFDYGNDRAMDGREIGEGKGWATEKFKTTNKFKRHPELNSYKKFFKYKMKASLGRRKKRLKDRIKSKNKKRMRLLGNGKVYVSMTNDPAKMDWVDQQRNKAYSWNDRHDNNMYPSWEQYKK
jgi:hypothetical protein